MRISDWSSDVCSSDLTQAARQHKRALEQLGNLSGRRKEPCGDQYGGKASPEDRDQRQVVAQRLAQDKCQGKDQRRAPDHGIPRGEDARRPDATPPALAQPDIGARRAEDRQSAGKGKSGEVRVDIGVRRIIKQKNEKLTQYNL